MRFNTNITAFKKPKNNYSGLKKIGHRGNRTEDLTRTEDLISIICIFMEIFLERSGAKNLKFDTFLLRLCNKRLLWFC